MGTFVVNWNLSRFSASISDFYSKIQELTQNLLRTSEEKLCGWGLWSKPQYRVCLFLLKKSCILWPKTHIFGSLRAPGFLPSLFRNNSSKKMPIKWWTKNSPWKKSNTSLKKKVISEAKILYQYRIVSRKKTNIVSILYRMKKNLSLKGDPGPWNR